VVVIGAGGGGLSAAAMLSRYGMDVLLLERHHKVGGYMTNFTRGDYRFEVSLHAMDALDPEPMKSDPDWTRGMNVAAFQELGIWGLVEPVRADPMYTVAYPEAEHQFSVPADVEEYRALLQEVFPHEAEGIDSLFDTMLAVDEVMRVILDYQYSGRDIEGEDAQDFLNEIATRDLYDELMLVQQYMESTTLSEFLAEHISDQKLVTIWTQLAGFAGASPDEVAALFFMVMWNNYHIGGYYYFEGGSQAVSDALAQVMEEHGGQIRLDSLVTAIDVQDGRASTVRTADGACFDARWVVSNANAPATLLDMVGAEHMPDDADSPFYAAKLEQGNDESLLVGLSAFQVCLGVDHDYSALFGDCHEVMFSQSYSQQENFQWYTDSDIANAPYAIANYTMLDPQAAPAGKNTICLTSIMAYDWQEQWHWSESHATYDALKEEVGLALVARAEADILPGLTDHVEVVEVGSPLTMEGFTLNPMGTIFGWDNTPEQSMGNRLPQQTPIENLLLSGAWTFPGGGQSAVLSSGMLAGMTILGEELGD